MGEASSDLARIREWLAEVERSKDLQVYAATLRMVRDELTPKDSDLLSVSVSIDGLKLFEERRKGAAAVKYEEDPFATVDNDDNDDESVCSSATPDNGFNNCYDDIEISASGLSAFRSRSQTSEEPNLNTLRGLADFIDDDEWESDPFESGTDGSREGVVGSRDESEDDDIIVADSVIGEADESEKQSMLASARLTLKSNDDESDILHSIQDRHEFDINLLEAGFLAAESSAKSFSKSIHNALDTLTDPKQEVLSIQVSKSSISSSCCFVLSVLLFQMRMAWIRHIAKTCFS